jgi:signal peptidase I
MSNKGVFKLILSILLFAFGIWMEVILPFVLIFLIVDSSLQKPYLVKLLEYVKKKYPQRLLIIEWGVAFGIATYIVYVILNNFVGVYTFHTASMQGTFESGDVLIVNKMIPGARKRANSVSWYNRIKGIKSVDYKDVLMFNFPEGDSLLKNRPTESYYYLQRLYGEGKVSSGPENWTEVNYLRVTKRPRYVKRVYGLPGDSIIIDNCHVYANGKHITFPNLSIQRYKVTSSLKKQLYLQDIRPFNELKTEEGLVWEMYYKDYKRFPNNKGELKMDCLPKNYPDPLVFPFNIYLLWNMHNLGPLYIPKRGDKIELTHDNLLLYKRLIEVFEQNKVDVKGDTVYVNNQPTQYYKFKMNYFWVLGDNGPHSYDSRFWGFVPENHIIGKVWGVLISKDPNPKKPGLNLRENRFLKKIK